MIAEGASRVSGAPAALGLRAVVDVVDVVDVIDVVEVACFDGVGSEVGVEVAVERGVRRG
jgi:hypothetical protein